MKINWIYFLVITSLLTSCTAAQKTAVPTSTIAATTATAAIIPTSTPTGTPIPKPVGGSGGLMILVNNEIRLVNADGSGEKTVISKQQFEKEFAPIPSKTGIPYWSANISPDGKKLLVLTCTRTSYSCETYKMYLSDIDFKRVRTSQEYKGGFMEWSSDSSKIPIQATRIS